MSDMKEQLTQRMNEINETLTIFGRDPILLLNATVIEQLALEDGGTEPLVPGADGSLHIPTTTPPRPQCMAQQVVGLRTLDGKVVTRPPRVTCHPRYVPKREERPPNNNRKDKTPDKLEEAFSFDPPSASSPRRPADLLRKQPFEYFNMQKQEDHYDDDRGYQHRLNGLIKKVPPAKAFRGEATTFALWAERLRSRAARTPVHPVDALDILS